MSTTQLNPVLFGDANILSVVEGLAGLPASELGIEAELAAAGVEPVAQAALTMAFFRAIYRVADAAFRAGYLAGRDPDRLVLGKLGSPYSG